MSETKKAGSFTIPGIGKLVLVKRKARMGRNPGKAIKIPAKTVDEGSQSGEGSDCTGEEEVRKKGEPFARR